MPGGGGLHVWPGSHREIYPNMGSKLEHVTTPEYEEIFNRWVRLQPLELHGERGDVVIIHHRLLLCDYQRSDCKTLIAQRPSPDVWEDWPAIAALPAHLRDAPSDYTLSPLPDDQLVPASWSAKDRLSGANSSTGDPSSIRKSDASILARGRQVGDVWIALSDDPKTANASSCFREVRTWTHRALGSASMARGFLLYAALTLFPDSQTSRANTRSKSKA